jgi:hypothetical protein
MLIRTGPLSKRHSARCSPGSAVFPTLLASWATADRPLGRPGEARRATMLMISPPLVADHKVLSELLHGVDAMLTDVDEATQH